MILVLFDIDGTLLTSSGIGRVAISEALEGVCGRRISTENVEFSGRTDPAIILDILQNTGFSEQEARTLLPECLDCYARQMAKHIRPEHVTLLPGILAAVSQLDAHPRVQLGILTGNLEKTALLKLEGGGIGRYFPFGAYGSDEEIRDLLPAVAAGRARAYCGREFTPDQTIVIGDTEHDVSCSHFHGAHAVAVATGRIGMKVLQHANPHLLLPDLSSPRPLIDYVESLLD